MKNYIYAAILILLFAVGTPQANAEKVLSSSSIKINAIDPSPNSNLSGRFYPGVRGANQLIIYTPKYGLQTHTNEFGKEAVVVNGTVTKLTGADSIIPLNGFVISGHGKAKKWISKNLIVGTKVHLASNKKTLKSKTTPESYTFQAEQKIKEVSEIIRENKTSICRYQAINSEQLLNLAQKKLTLANAEARKKNYKQTKTLAIESSDYADRALYQAMPSKTCEFKGIWIRPKEKNAQEIAQTLDNIKRTGIDNVFLETYFHGYTIFPSQTLRKYGVKMQMDDFANWDPLDVWIKEAHKRGMKIHAWFQTFYVGNKPLSKHPKHVLSLYPSWANVQKTNYKAEKPMPSPSEHNGYFLDPANPEVQQYLTDIIKEIVTKYSVDGINLDYIRYPASLSTKFPNYTQSNWGYSEYARHDFQSKYNIDPVDLSYKQENWDKWLNYRQNKINMFVSKIKPLAPNISVSAVIFPNEEDSKIIKLQNWQCWARCRHIDILIPLILGSDEKLAEVYMQNIIRYSNCAKVYPTLFQAFTYGSPSDMLLQIRAARKNGADGILIFDYSHLSKDFITALTARAFRSKQESKR